MRKFLLFLTFILLLTGCKSRQPVKPEFVFEPKIEVVEPEFNIVSISIIQADLINTQFEAVVRVDNPNKFAVDISSFNYELYGNGKFWANGCGRDILKIPAQSSCETEFRFVMNFINMNRRLLDDVIAMRQVRYRFAGNVDVEPGISKLPAFHMSFERSGLSEVRQKAEKNTQAEKVYRNTIRSDNKHDEFGNW
ncbi:MAG: LEA type 2 family protein [Treponema sp.]|jgi:LEA14-like dessication related protein|nr:LEA type 2 family protein [Treponema sp.]